MYIEIGKTFMSKISTPITIKIVKSPVFIFLIVVLFVCVLAATYVLVLLNIF
jgi:hypothetical protein